MPLKMLILSDSFIPTRRTNVAFLQKKTAEPHFANFVEVL